MGLEAVSLSHHPSPTHECLQNLKTASRFMCSWNYIFPLKAAVNIILVAFNCVIPKIRVFKISQRAGFIIFFPS